MTRRHSWLRAVSEGAVIVASILLAFGIQAWWDGLKEREDENRILSALLEEAQGNADWLRRMKPYHKLRIAAAVALTNAAVRVQPGITSDSMDAVLRTLMGTFSPPLDRGALDVALAVGRLDRVADGGLRARIAAWDRRIRVADEQADNDVMVDREIWMPFLRRHASVPQIMNAEISVAKKEVMKTLGVDEYGAETSAVRSVDHRNLLLQPEFVNLLQEKKWVSEDALYNYSSIVEPELAALIQELQAKLGRE